MSNIKLWGFIDFDNTMMATESKALPSLIKRFNAIYGDKIDAPLSLDIFLKNFHGKARQSLCDSLSEYYKIDVVHDDLFTDREWDVMQLYAEDGVEMAPNIIDVFGILRSKGVCFSLVSNNSAQRCLAAMRFATNGQGDKLASIFGTRFFESGSKQKPLPDVYWHALAQVKADARKSFAVEDSVTGVKAAVTAGLRTFGYIGFCQDDKDNLSKKLLSNGAVEVFEEWEEFPAMLDDYFK